MAEVTGNDTCLMEAMARMTFIASLISISLVRMLVVLAPELNNLPKSYVPSPDIVVALAWAFLVR